MKILDVRPKEIHVTLEIGIEEIARILEFFDLVSPIYTKMMKDSDIATGDYVADEFIGKLRLVYDDVKKGT